MNDLAIQLHVHTVTNNLSSYQYLKGTITLFLNDSHEISMPMGQRNIPLPAHGIYLFYDQNRSFELKMKSEQMTSVCILTLPINTLHKILSQGTDELNFSQSAIFEKEQYHHFEMASSTITRCVHEVISNPDNQLLKEAKKYAILDDYFNSSRRQTKYQCPFLNQKENVNKVRAAKEFLIEDLNNSPTIKQIAKHVALNEHNLKTGFKEIYGKTIHSFLKDYKMTKARELILLREFQIAEIADQLGYTNVSHFIDAFKKKFGITPKKFELSLP
jgi:AraC-like DNA-binding protein